MVKNRINGVRRSVYCVIALLLTVSVGTSARAAEPKEVIPMGNTVGIQLKMDGVLVVGLSKLVTENGEVSPAREAGIMPGDVITKLGEREIRSAAEFLTAMSELNGEDVLVTVRRNGETMQFTAKPFKSPDAGYQLGLWLRDGVAGIGTVTFLDPSNGAFGALGHAISDIDTGIIMPLGHGTIMDSTVVDIRRGVSGTPGELCGSFDLKTSRGSILKNTSMGIYGIMDMTGGALGGRSAMPVAGEDEISLGKAVILANVRGSEVDEYEVEICRVYRNDGTGRSLMLAVTDERLLELTGGIVQGMSGSPIIQNGKLIGAVTHVLIGDPTRGYGISASNMLKQITDIDALDNAA